LKNFHSREISCLKKIKRCYVKDENKSFGEAIVTFTDSKIRNEFLKPGGLPTEISNFKAIIEKNEAGDTKWDVKDASMISRVMGFIFSWSISFLVLLFDSVIMYGLIVFKFNTQFNSEFFVEAIQNTFSAYFNLDYRIPVEIAELLFIFTPMLFEFLLIINGKILKEITALEQHSVNNYHFISYFMKLNLFYLIDVLFSNEFVPLLIFLNIPIEYFGDSSIKQATTYNFIGNSGLS
jgi:hypothetical protein